MAEQSRRTERQAPPEPTKAETSSWVVADGIEVDQEETAVVVAPAGGLGETWQPSPIARMSGDEFLARIASMKIEKARIIEIKKAILTEGDPDDPGTGDYGTIPGTKKKSLFQSGAETFNLFAKLQPRYFRREIIGDGVTTPHFRIDVECHLVDETGAVHGTGGGTANSWEEKYRYRGDAALICPDCGEVAIYTSRKGDPGFFCWRKFDGCGHNFEPDNREILSQGKPRKAEHPNPYDLFNTVEQMADKRSYVKATRTTHALSGIFTQGDATDMGDPTPQKTTSTTSTGVEFANQATVLAIQDRAEHCAKEFEGVSANEILREVFKVLGVQNIDKVPQTAVPSVVGAINSWEPGCDASTD